MHEPRRARVVPISGPKKIPRLLLNAKRENARAWVRGVLISVIIARIVLYSGFWDKQSTLCNSRRSCLEYRLRRCRVAYTIVPADIPATHLKRIICHTVLLNPNSPVVIPTPVKENTSTGFLPRRSAARPHSTIRHICVAEKSDSYLWRIQSVP